MLQPISQLNLEIDGQFTCMLRGYVALCPDTGAMLSRSSGRAKYAPKYILILPNQSLEDRGGMFAKYDWDYPTGRKFVRAWSDDEAIDMANQKLAKMLAKREKNATATK